MTKRTRFILPPEINDAGRQAAYRVYVERQNAKGYIAWDDVCACFVAAFDAMRSDGEQQDKEV